MTNDPGDMLRCVADVDARARAYMASCCFSGHDFAHVDRVRRLCLHLAPKEPDVDTAVLECAALLHDLGREHERRDPRIDHAEKSAELAQGILTEAGFPSERIGGVLHAIRAHRYSKGVTPETVEARLLQDADRVDICGAVGLAMTFAYGGAHDRTLYAPEDPLAEQRDLDDSRYSLDHVYVKLLRLPETLHTQAAREIALARTAFLWAFLDQFRREVAGEI